MNAVVQMKLSEFTEIALMARMKQVQIAIAKLQEEHKALMQEADRRVNDHIEQQKEKGDQLNKQVQ